MKKLIPIFLMLVVSSYSFGQSNFQTDGTGLSSFNTAQGAPSAEQMVLFDAFTATSSTGSSAMLTAPVGYQISSTSGVGFMDTLFVPFINDTILGQPVFIRLTGAVPGSYTADTLRFKLGGGSLGAYINFQSGTGWISPNGTVTACGVFTSNAGADQNICGSATLSGVVGGGAPGGVWSSSGDGGFTDINNVITDYFPGPTDIALTTVTLTLTTTGCSNVQDNLILTISAGPTADAGIDINSCGLAPVPLSASTTIASGGIWTISGGTGTFDSNTNLMANYTPSAADLANGVVILTLTTTGNGSCSAAMDNVTINLGSAPIITVGLPATKAVCQNNGITMSLIVSSASPLNYNWLKNGSPIGAPDTSNYTIPSFTAPDAGTYTVDITNACGAITSPASVVTFSNTATISAGSDISFCGLSTQITAASRSAEITNVSWRPIGGSLGVSIDPDSTVLDPFIYFAGDSAQGNVFLEVSSITENCIGYADTIQLIKSIIGLPAVDFSQAAFASANTGAIDIGATTSGNTPIWQVTGTGLVSGTGPYFYTPSAQDLNDGFVEIVGNSSGSGACGSYFASDTTRISLTAQSALYTMSGSLSEFPMRVIVSKKVNSFWTTVFENVIGSNSFTVADMTNGTYKIQGVPLGGGNKLSTYVGGSSDWEIAEEIVINNGNVTGKNISLQTLTVAPILLSTYLNGEDKISGKILLDLLGTITNLKVQAATDVKPVQSATINVYSTDGSSKVATTQTDANGFYTIPDLSANTVKVEVEYPGTVLQGTTLATPSQKSNVTTDGEGDPTIKNVQIVKIDDASKGKLTAIESGQYLATASTSNLFPNPAKGEVYIRLTSELKNKTYFKAIVFDAAGKPVATSSYAGAAEVLKLNIEGLEKGFYHVYLTAEEKSMMEKLVIE